MSFYFVITVRKWRHKLRVSLHRPKQLFSSTMVSTV